MQDSDPVHFFESEEIFEKASSIFEQEKASLQVLLPDADIQHVGSCAISGALAKFDINIQIRVGDSEFQNCVEMMKSVYSEKHPELWNHSFAIFKKDNIDYLLTLKNSKFDDFYRVRDYLIANPKILQEYNDLKRGYEGKPYSEYRKAKIAFLGGNGQIKFLQY
jgi:GrpB-like predicted nucleotidyltransferase (UPF0157 family)